LISPIRGVQMRLPKSLEISAGKVRQMGPLLRGMHPVVPDNGYHNTIAAFRKRCNYFSAKRATPFVVDSAMKFCEMICPQTLEGFEWTESLYNKWNSKFGIEKRNRMDRAVRSFFDKTEPFTKDSYSSKEIFVKVEALLVTHKPNWAPRIIYKGTDIYNAISGPVFNELMRRFDHCMQTAPGKYRYTTAYRKTPDEFVPAVEKMTDDDFWIEADFSSNDKFQCADVQLIEVAFMRMLGCPEWFIRLHLSTNKFKVRNTKHGIKATLEHQFPTGGTDTTFRNCLWNACILYGWLRTVKPVACSAVILGDDMIARVTGKVEYAQKIYTSIAADAQMVAEVERHTRLDQATFLSRQFVEHFSDCWHLTIPILGKAIARFNMRANQNQAVSDHAYMAGKSVGYAYEFRYFPPIQAMFLKRFMHEWAFVRKEEHDRIDAAVSWNAKQAGVSLSNIKGKLRVEETLTMDDFTKFTLRTYGLLGIEVLQLFQNVVLSSEHLDFEGITVKKLMVGVVDTGLYE